MQSPKGQLLRFFVGRLVKVHKNKIVTWLQNKKKTKWDQSIADSL